MHPSVLAHQAEIAALCRRFGVTRLEVFGSAARGEDFDPARSDVDLLVQFTPKARFDFANFADLKDSLEALFGRRVDLIDRPAIEKSHNEFRRARILGDAQLLFAA
ncbi:nucleotidyltransferase family protein [Falsiroseomonas sp.]|uniref:nucleotidyltransferase family protein n=1 Tax=Falsiroseomonas sp. TaxID=2870721 RepID=UPI002734E339|nr:nucleotidyltransferase domain-containing protein [Falsiroseomonas sp.]MDP3418074.1 nucleotidyltransferase domain-containing protein [Falsiroseomonas sp.]